MLTGERLPMLLQTGAGTDGAGASFLRQSASVLTSAGPDTTFVVRVDVRVDPDAGGDEDAWVAGLAQQVRCFVWNSYRWRCYFVPYFADDRWPQPRRASLSLGCVVGRLLGTFVHRDPAAAARPPSSDGALLGRPITDCSAGAQRLSFAARWTVLRRLGV